MEEFKFNMGVWELVKVSEQVSREEEVFKDHESGSISRDSWEASVVM